MAIKETLFCLPKSAKQGNFCLLLLLLGSRGLEGLELAWVLTGSGEEEMLRCDGNQGALPEE